ncbi:MAG: hypothetical protein L0027_00510, partial [Candidatus Rokubacteria bacterium]|nr:hypothetical protein [Candidatus Rokubacteria bacterium]
MSAPNPPAGTAPVPAAAPAPAAPVAIDPGLAAVIEDVLDRRDARQRENVITTLAALAEPRREPFRDVLPQGPGGDGRPDPGQPRIEPGLRSVVSRYQPSDSLYRSLYRENRAYEGCRTPEIDHWCHQWLLGLVLRDRAHERLAFEN